MGGGEWEEKSEEEKVRIKKENEKKAARIWKTTGGGTQMQALTQISDAVKQTSWFKAYVGKVKGAVSTLCQQGRPVTLVCIKGGPVTCVEQMEMSRIKMEIEGDLKASSDIDADIDQKTFKTFLEMKTKFYQAGPSSTDEDGIRVSTDGGGGVGDDGGDTVSRLGIAEQAAEPVGRFSLVRRLSLSAPTIMQADLVSGIPQTIGTCILNFSTLQHVT
jgi:hypothetical protein